MRGGSSRRLKANPPDLWVPLQQGPLIAGSETSLLRQPISAWLRVIGRLRPGATVAGMDARLTGLLRQWMQHEAGYPPNWMATPAGAGVGVMKEQYGRSLQILLGVCGLVLLIACATWRTCCWRARGRGAGRTAGDRSSFARTALLVVQATLSVVLVAGSTMLGRSLGNLEGQNFHFERENRVLVSVGRPSSTVTGERLSALYRNLEERLGAIPGVQGVGLALYNPLTDNWGEGVIIAGKPLAEPIRVNSPRHMRRPRASSLSGGT